MRVLLERNEFGRIKKPLFPALQTTPLYGTSLAISKPEEQIAMQKKTDNEIKHDVNRELSWDTRTWNKKIVVEVTNGVVMLEGIVSSYAQKIAAQTAAHRVNGVMDVANNILIKIQHRHSDAEIAHALRQALEWGAFVPEV